MKFTIFEQNACRWNEEDRLTLAQILIKAGYTVRLVKPQKPDGKPGTKIGVEVETDGEE